MGLGFPNSLLTHPKVNLFPIPGLGGFFSRTRLLEGAERLCKE